MIPSYVLARYSRMRKDVTKKFRYDLGPMASAMRCRGYDGPPVRLAVDLDRGLAVILDGHHRVAAAQRIMPPLDVPTEVTYQALPEEYPWASPIQDGDRGLFMAG